MIKKMELHMPITVNYKPSYFCVVFGGQVLVAALYCSYISCVSGDGMVCRRLPHQDIYNLQECSIYFLVDLLYVCDESLLGKKILILSSFLKVLHYILFCCVSYCLNDNC